MPEFFSEVPKDQHIHQDEMLGGVIYLNSLNTVQNLPWKHNYTYKSSVNTVNYHQKLKAKVILPEQPYTYFKDTYLNATGRVFRHYALATNQWLEETRTGTMYNSAYDHYPPAGVHAMPDEELNQQVDECLARLLLKVKNQRVNLAQAIAERNQAIRLVGETAVSIAKAIGHLKRGDITGAARAVGVHVKSSSRQASNFRRAYDRDQAKAVANGWIKIQYGVRPLVKDIQGAAESLSEFFHRPEKDIQMVRHKLTRPYARKKVFTDPATGRSVTTDERVEHTVESRAVFKIDCQLSYDVMSLGLTNPLTVAWELMPWSFVIDWFIPIGRTINLLDATMGCSFVAGGWTRHYKSASQRNETWTFRYFDGGYGTGDTVSRRDVIWIQRVPLSEFPSVPLPRFKNPLSVEHSLNALALLLQQMSGLKKGSDFKGGVAF